MASSLVCISPFSPYPLYLLEREGLHVLKPQFQQGLQARTGQPYSYVVPILPRVPERFTKAQLQFLAPDYPSLPF